jgi:mannose-1-phosphate guanylyltransferase
MPFAALLDAHARRAPLATLAVVAGLPAGSGPVGLDGEGRVVRLRDRSVAREREGAAFVGVQLLSAEARARLPERGCLVRDLYQPAMARGAAILAAPVAKRFFDIGSPAAYLEANLAWLGDRASYLGPGASLAPGIALAAAVVGAGARVQGSGALERVVVWPGASVRAPLADAIVTRSGRIVRIRETATRS